MKFYLIVLVLIFCRCSSSVKEASGESGKSTESVELITEVVDTLTNEEDSLRDDCLNLFESIDRKKIKRLCKTYSTSTIINPSDFGQTAKKGGSYTLAYVDSLNRKVEYMGQLFVTYEKSPWWTFQEDEKWFKIILVDGIVKIGAGISVGQNIEEVETKLPLEKLTESSYKYESECEYLELEVSSEKLISKITLTKKN